MTARPSAKSSSTEYRECSSEEETEEDDWLAREIEAINREHDRIIRNLRMEQALGHPYANPDEEGY